MSEAPKKEKRPWRRVSPESDVVKIRIAENRDFRKQLNLDDACFGASLIDRVERERRMKQALKTLEAPQDVFDSHHMWVYAPTERSLRKLRDTFVKITKGSEYKRFAAFEFLETIVRNPELKEKIEAEISTVRKINPVLSMAAMKYRHVRDIDQDEGVLVDKLYTLISRSKKKVSLDLWTEMLIAYRNEFKETEERFLAVVLPKLKNDFLYAWERVAGSPVFPMPVEHVKEVMDTLIFRVVDGLTEELKDISGSYGRDREEVSVSLHSIQNETLREVSEIFTHEMFHALSSRMVVVRDKNFLDVSVPDVVNSRVGLRMPDRFEGQKLSWLNEAVTESLTGRLLGVPPRTYLDECAILDYLCDEGKMPILFNVFSKAYFEDQDAQSEEGKSIPRWRALRQAINDSFSPTFLLEIDKKIQAVGAKEVRRLLESGEFKPDEASR